MTIIGIAGGTGSGKTTVVKKIAQALPPHCAAIVPLDSYYNDTTDLTDEERRAINFDHPDAFDWKLLTEHIKMLKNGQAIEQPTYSYIISNRLPETVHVEPKPVIILEGIMKYYNSLYNIHYYPQNSLVLFLLNFHCFHNLPQKLQYLQQEPQSFLLLLIYFHYLLSLIYDY